MLSPGAHVEEHYSCRFFADLIFNQDKGRKLQFGYVVTVLTNVLLGSICDAAENKVKKMLREELGLAEFGTVEKPGTLKDI